MAPKTSTRLARPERNRKCSANSLRLLTFAVASAPPAAAVDKLALQHRGVRCHQARERVVRTCLGTQTHIAIVLCRFYHTNVAASGSATHPKRRLRMRIRPGPASPPRSCQCRSPRPPRLVLDTCLYVVLHAQCVRERKKRDGKKLPAYWHKIFALCTVNGSSGRKACKTRDDTTTS